MRPVLLHMTTVPDTLLFLRGQVQFMQTHGFDVHALSSPGELLSRFAADTALPVHALALSRAISPLQDLRALGALLRLFHHLQPTIVHAHTPKAGMLGMLAAQLSGVPVRLFHLHGLRYTTTQGPLRRLLQATERLSCQCAHRVLCVSPSVRETAVTDRIVTAEKSTVLLGGSINGIDADATFNPALHSAAGRATRARFGIPPEAPVIGFVGRIVRDKGVGELAAAWVQVRHAVPHAHLLIVGPFEPQDPVAPEVEAALRSDPHVHLVGQDWHTPPLYAAMDLLTLPTYREGFPVVPLEAAAMGLPVVATRVTGCIDAVVDGHTGTLIPPYDVPALAAALCRYLQEPERRHQHGAAARARVLADYRPESIWAATLAEYDRLLAARGLLRSGESPAPSARP
jgi:glycosyltransferase involved in cell wall biosynthesis